MNGLREAARVRQRMVLLALVALAACSVGLFVFGQPLAALLAPVVGVLVLEICWRDQHARTLAQQISANAPAEKLEVPGGAWGELSRAVNGMVQQRRVDQRLQAAAPPALPTEALHAMLHGELCTGQDPRVVSVLLIGAAERRPDDHARPSTMHAWQRIAAAAHAHAEEHGALLQPHGDALMLVFGAFAEQSADATARAALLVGTALQAEWRNAANHEGMLAASVASGPCWITMLSGLGCSVLGAPVQQASHMLYLAHNAGYRNMLCNEAVYFTLRSRARANWQSTPLRLPVANRAPQPVYCWNDAA